MSKFIVISIKQLFANILLTSLFISAFTFILIGFSNYLDLPNVYINNITDKCIKVENFKNGDAYTCEDLNILLKKYNTVKM